MRKGLWLVIAVLAAVVLTASVALCQEATKAVEKKVVPAAAETKATLSKEQIVDIAKKTVADKGVALDTVDIIYDEGNGKWAEMVAIVEESPADPNKGNLPKGILENKKYQVVFIDVKDSEMDHWAFIDPDTGNVLEFYSEK